MASSSHHGFDCPICFDTLLEPHALPCGHSFCGPPRKCLEALRQQQGGLICAICNQCHNLKLSDLKPLFGIRDAAQDFHQKLAEVKRNRLPSCSTHNEEIHLWCVECDIGICDACVEEAHGDHTHKSFKFVMRQKAARLVPKIPELLSILTEMDSNIQQVSSKVRHLKDAEAVQSVLLSELENLKEFFTKMNADAESVELFCKSKSADVDYSLISDWEGKLQLYCDVQTKMSNIFNNVQTQTECSSELPLFASAENKETKDTQADVKADQRHQESQTYSEHVKICSCCFQIDGFGSAQPFIVDLSWKICDIRRIRNIRDECLRSNLFTIGHFTLQLECVYSHPGPYLGVYLHCTCALDDENFSSKVAFNISIVDCRDEEYKSKADINYFSQTLRNWGFRDMIHWSTVFDNARYYGKGDLFIECAVDLFGREFEDEWIPNCEYRIAAPLKTV